MRLLREMFYPPRRLEKFIFLTENLQGIVQQLRSKMKKKKKQKRKRKRKNHEPRTLNVAPRPSGVLLVCSSVFREEQFFPCDKEF